MGLILENNRIKLRKLKTSEAEVIKNFAKDKKITKYTFVIPAPLTTKQAQVFIRKANREIKNKTSYSFGIELRENSKLIGMMNLAKIDWKNKNAEVGFWLAREYQGKGLAKESLSLILDFGFRKLNLNRIQARVLHKNNQAQGLLKKVGFKLEGRLRRKTHFKNKWYDDLIYGILKS